MMTTRKSRMAKMLCSPGLPFGIRHLDFLRHSSFVIRQSSGAPPMPPRRRFLETFSTGLGGIALASLLVRESPAASPRATRAIGIFLQGGLSQSPRGVPWLLDVRLCARGY
jgi:hypothetical protein